MATAEALEPLVGHWAALAFVFVLGTLFGSFANVCIYRWPPTPEHPKGRSVVTPGSHCFVCGKPVRWYDNVPIVAWLWLRGRCRDCGTSFSARYILVEAATGMLFAAVWWLTVVGGAELEPLQLRTLRFVIYAAFVFVMVVITFIDLDHKLILDKITFPAIPIFYLLGLALPGQEWSDGLIGAAIGYFTVRLIADLFWLVFKREGMGYGDGKLLAVIGALLGWKAVVAAVFGGSIIGTVIAVPALLIARRRARHEEEGGASADPEAAVARAEADIEPVASTTTATGHQTDAAIVVDDAGADAAGFGRIELPFGPFLIAGALFYMFAQSWLEISFFSLYY